MPYKLVRMVQNCDTLGQCWLNETMTENIELCKYQTIEPVFKRLLPKEGKILEAGCGLGRWVFYLRDLGYPIQGIDYSEDAISKVKQYDDKAVIEWGDVHNLQYPNEAFDIVISLGVVEHFEDGPQRSLMEMKRVLKKDGLLLISMPPKNLLRKVVTHPLLNLYFFIKKLSRANVAFSEYRYSQKEFKAKLENAGFKIIETVVDEFRFPKNMGVFKDFPLLRHPVRKWELNGLGNIFAKIMSYINPAISCGGLFFVCKIATNLDENK